MAVALVVAQQASAGKLDVKTFNYTGPLTVREPVMIDSVDLNKKKYDASTDLRTGKKILSTPNNISWMPGTDSYCFARETTDGKDLVAVDVATGTEKMIANNIPDESYTMAPTGDYMIVMKRVEGKSDFAWFDRWLKDQPQWWESMYENIPD